MKLLTKKIIERFREVGSQENNPNPIVIAKFFNPVGAGTWYATEYNETEQVFFGYVSIFGGGCDEWGYFSLAELEELKLPFGFGIERDIFGKEKRIKEYLK